MKNGKACVGGMLCLVCAAGGLVFAKNQGRPITAKADAQDASIKVEGFYCNIKALTLAERARHMKLTSKLLSSRKETVETQKGYELQYRGGSVTLAELAEWVRLESKCCPFFDFHIDLEEQGQLTCLGLTGKEGVKEFIRMEFGIK